MTSSMSPSTVKAMRPQWQLPSCAAMALSRVRKPQHSAAPHAPRRGPDYPCRPAQTEPCMRPHPLALALLVATLAACKPATPPAEGTQPPATAETPASQADAAFEALSRRYLDEGLALVPVSATQIGDHRFDDRIDDLGQDGRDEALEWNRAMLAGLDRIDIRALSREN